MRVGTDGHIAGVLDPTKVDPRSVGSFRLLDVECDIAAAAGRVVGQAVFKLAKEAKLTLEPVTRDAIIAEVRATATVATLLPGLAEASGAEESLRRELGRGPDGGFQAPAARTRRASAADQDQQPQPVVTAETKQAVIAWLSAAMTTTLVSLSGHASRTTLLEAQRQQAAIVVQLPFHMTAVNTASVRVLAAAFERDMRLATRANDTAAAAALPSWSVVFASHLPTELRTELQEASETARLLATTEGPSLAERLLNDAKAQEWLHGRWVALAARKPTVAAIAARDDAGAGTAGPRNPWAGLTCWQCGREGHVQRVCKAPKKSNQEPSTKGGQEPSRSGQDF